LSKKKLFDVADTALCLSRVCATFVEGRVYSRAGRVEEEHHFADLQHGVLLWRPARPVTVTVRPAVDIDFPWLVGYTALMLGLILPIHVHLRAAPQPVESVVVETRAWVELFLCRCGRVRLGGKVHQARFCREQFDIDLLRVVAVKEEGLADARRLADLEHRPEGTVQDVIAYGRNLATSDRAFVIVGLRLDVQPTAMTISVHV